jgi:hypothetical protein
MSHMPRETTSAVATMTTKLLCENYVANDHKLNAEQGKMEMVETENIKIVDNDAFIR